MSITIPTKIPVPFGYAAGAGEITTPIPTASQIGVVNGRASLHDGFPPLTFTPLSTGGVPPFGADFNGILNEITSITQWQQAGGFFPYDSAFSSAISGYPIGAVIQAANYQGFWLSTTNGNTTNPDTGGAGWTSLVFEGLQAITVTTANVTVSQLQSAYPILVISGALTGARNLILPAVVGQWIIQNNTTGAFTLTVKTAAGTGVVATQGQSTYLYGNGTNIYFASSVGVQSFNTRIGTVTLNATDVTNALGYAPIGPNLTGMVTSVGNAATVVTNANLTGAITSTGNATSLGSFTSAQLATALTNETGSGSAVFSTSPTLVTPFLGTPAALVGTNITGTATAFTASNVTTNANLSGAVTSSGSNVTSLGSFTSAQLLTALTTKTGTGFNVFSTSPTLVTPALGTPSALVGTNITGTATAFTASNVTTNANLTGAITSTGNATSLGSFTSAQLATALTNETGSGSAVFSASPTLTGTPIAPTAATNTSTTQIATTAFANPGALLSNSGYQRLPSGLIMQWGLNTTPAGANNVLVNFPIAFASAVYSVTGNAVGFAGYNGDQVQFNAVNTSNFRAYTTTNQVSFYWFAIGN